MLTIFTMRSKTARPKKRRIPTLALWTGRELRPLTLRVETCRPDIHTPMFKDLNNRLDDAQASAEPHHVNRNEAYESIIIAHL
mmetsp:Transcript_8788/g.18593  ORF Transcript_8788/g.18593 Transcript_8788/m.18593 type:complete len:83 (+) Transcript_8788:254-502(+)